MINYILLQNFQTYNKFDLLRKEGLYQGPGPHEIAFTFFMPLKN